MYKFCFKGTHINECDEFIHSLKKCTNARVVVRRYDAMTDLFEVEVEFTCEHCMKEVTDNA